MTSSNMETLCEVVIPDLPGLPPAVGRTGLIHQEGSFRVYATELEIMWRWDLFEGDRYLHTGCAQRPETCIAGALSKIRFFGRPDVARIIATDRHDD